MKTDSRYFRPAWRAALLFSLAVLRGGLARLAADPESRRRPLRRAAPRRPPRQATLQDRVLAVVDEDPILASDVERAIRLGLEQPRPGETDERFRRRVLDALIDQRLQFHEIDRFNFEQVPVDEIQKRVAESAPASRTRPRSRRP